MPDTHPSSDVLKRRRIDAESLGGVAEITIEEIDEVLTTIERLRAEVERCRESR